MSHSMSNHLEVPWWPSQISLKLCDCDPCPMKWKSWKFELLTIYCFQGIAIQRSNHFPKIAPHRIFFVFGAIFRVQIKHSESSPKLKNYTKFCDFWRIINILLDICKKRGILNFPVNIFSKVGTEVYDRNGFQTAIIYWLSKYWCLNMASRTKKPCFQEN